MKHGETQAMHYELLQGSEALFRWKRQVAANYKTLLLLDAI